jgi:hypothetical protein
MLYAQRAGSHLARAEMDMAGERSSKFKRERDEGHLSYDQEMQDDQQDAECAVFVVCHLRIL